MKNLIIAFGIICSTTWAATGRRVDLSAGNPLPSTYSTTFPSLILSDIPSSNKNVILTATIGGVACTVDNGSDVTAPTNTIGGQYNYAAAGREFYLIASQPSLVLNIGSFKNVYCRNFGSGNLTSGWISVVAY